jgi:hypothetical protein
LAKSKQKNQKSSIKNTVLGIGIVVAIVGSIGYFAINAMIPVNGDYPVFAAPTNVYIKTISTADGKSVFASQSLKGGKAAGTPTGTHYPTLLVSQGNLVSLHVINEDGDALGYNHFHNLNIDEFNVHSKDLNRNEAQTITFVADKQGTFEYYDSLHSEMRGKIVVQ